MKEVIILIGNIGSGKSTLVKQYQEKGYVVISRDSLRYGIGGGEYVFNTKYEKIIHKTAIKMLRLFLELNVNIIIDETNVTKHLRKQYINIIRKCSIDYKITGIELPILSKQDSVDRRMTNPHGQPNRKIWEEVWEMFNKNYESPSFDEDFNKIIKL